MSFDEHLRNTHSRIDIGLDWFNDEDNKLLNQVADELNLSRQERDDLHTHVWGASLAAFDKAYLAEKIHIPDNEKVDRMREFFKNDGLSKAFDNDIEYPLSRFKAEPFLLDFHERINELLLQYSKRTTSLNINYDK